MANRTFTRFQPLSVTWFSVTGKHQEKSVYVKVSCCKENQRIQGLVFVTPPWKRQRGQLILPKEVLHGKTGEF